MSFLNWATEEKSLPNQRFLKHRKRVALELLDKFGLSFPEINYQMIWESPTINAQAWRLGSNRYVRVYGGLIRHPMITRYGLALTLAHETGHHLGGLPFDPDMRWMTWQGKADYWAARIAMPLVFGAKAHELTLRGARQLLLLQDRLSELMEGDEPDLSASCRDQIFRAGAAKVEIPPCAKQEFRECFGREYADG